MCEPRERTALADELAGAFLNAPWRATDLAESGAGALDRWPRWMEGLALAAAAAFRTAPVDRRADLAVFIDDWLAERGGDPEPVGIIRLLAATPDAGPGLRHDWPIARIDSPVDLAQRLELSTGQLAWLADVRGLERSVSDEQLRNYRYRAIPRRRGPVRVLEAPKARLKEVQRWVLHEILDYVPPHVVAHGFTRGRSVVSHAGLHTGRAIVLRLDLEDFFASVTAGRVFGLFRTLGYRVPVAHTLTGLCTNTIPQAVWHQIPRPPDPGLLQPHFWLGRRLATPHLPQGAPTSPALANLAAFRLDRRLAGLAADMQLRYTRYADDLTFSGSARLGRRRASFEALVTEIARAEGFTVNARKSAVHGSGARQSVCGIVVNVRPNVVRAEYDRLRAILHNCARHGPASQNREGLADFEAHLRGRVAWVGSLNPRRGEKLRRRFEQIDWD